MASAALLAPECLRRGRLRQFSAQYGGWVSIKLVLLSHALVVDPDADAPTAVSVTPRKRRNSLKMWMDLCLVENIAAVRKVVDAAAATAAAEGSAASMARRVSSGAGRDAGRHVFVVSTERPTAQEFRFDAASEEDREEWVRCLLLAKKLQSVNRGARGSASTAEAAAADAANQLAFFRFASSGSEDSDSDVENTPPLVSTPESSSPQQHSIRSAQSASKAAAVRSRPAAPVSLTILHIVAGVDDGTRATAFVPLSAASLDEIPVHRVKADAIQQLRKHHTRDIKADSSSSDRDRQRATLRLRDLAHRSLDWFSLHLEEFDQWLQDEQRPIGSYLTGLAGKKKVTLALRPANEMPFPTLQLSISGVKNKVSDLSQRTFTTYTIDVAFNDMTWQLSRRYKEFAALQEQLASKLPSKAASLPMLPPKHIYTPREGEFVERRRVQLEQYLHQLLVDPVISNDVLLMSFLGVVSTSRDPELSQSNKGVVHVTALHNSLHYGDIVLFSCKFGASVLQRTFTGSKYDHVGIVVPGASRSLLRIMEATSDGIQVFSLKLRLMAYSREVSNSIVVRRFDGERTPAFINDLNKFVQRVEGNPYSILGILHSTGESDRTLQDMMVTSDVSDAASATASTVSGSGVGEYIGSNESSASSTSSSQSSSPSSTAAHSTTSKAKKHKRKYFCSSLVASALKQVGWLESTRKSSSFWPGSFEDGGEIEGLLAAGVTLGPETRVDCRIVEVGLAIPDEKQQV